GGVAAEGGEILAYAYVPFRVAKGTDMVLVVSSTVRAGSFFLTGERLTYCYGGAYGVLPKIGTALGEDPQRTNTSTYRLDLRWTDIDGGDLCFVGFPFVSGALLSFVLEEVGPRDGAASQGRPGQKAGVTVGAAVAARPG
ncbi:hypothetical protein, partial [Enterovirga sp.]|uniref:hypothetical protein n=1 Tax=Enterovirga sp. TaxID=2026350 RepID=UPI002612D913